MEYSDDPKQIEKWLPLVMEGRDRSEEVTATRMVTGTDVDYGALTTELLDSLSGKEGFAIHFFSRVQDLRRDGDLWSVRVRDEKSGQNRDVQPKFVFIGAGGGTSEVIPLRLYLRLGIVAGRNFGNIATKPDAAHRKTRRSRVPRGSRIFCKSGSDPIYAGFRGSSRRLKPTPQ